MKVNVAKGRPTSIEHRFNDEADCNKEAKAFHAQHPNARKFTLNNLSKGFSFQPDPNSDLEERFIYDAQPDLIAPCLKYYEATENGQPIQNLGKLKSLYKEYTTTGDYKPIMEPTENGGRKGPGKPTARCIMKLCKGAGLVDEYLCLMVNPPFPHGSGADKGRRKGVQKYLPVVAGLVGVFATGLMWKKITKVFGSTRR
jgi:hypothetical protein